MVVPILYELQCVLQIESLITKQGKLIFSKEMGMRKQWEKRDVECCQNDCWQLSDDEVGKLYRLSTKQQTLH